MPIILILFITFVHSFHLSKTEINYDSETNSLQIASKVFIDDLEDELKMYGYTNLKIGTSLEASHVDSVLTIYFKEKLQITSNKNMANQYYLGKELSKDLIAIWAYIEIPLDQIPSEIFIKNTILTSLYNDQKNMVIIKKDNKMIEHETLDHKENTIQIDFND